MRIPALVRLAIATGAVVLMTPAAGAQLAERPGHSLDNPIDAPRDLSGLSIKDPRVRVVHTIDPGLAGGSMYLQQIDLWLGYQRGRNLTQREFRDRDGVFGDDGKLDGLRLADGATHMMSRSHVSSCAVCHNSPYRDGGAGATIAKNGGTGRNTPHMFGAGLLEMLGLQMRLEALAVADDNRDGWISREEATGKRAVIANVPGGADGQRQAIDYGSFEDADDDGRPDLNELFFPRYVDALGRWIPTARDMHSPQVAGYRLEAQVFGFGHASLPNRPPIATTLRAFSAGAFDIHSGLQACDPTLLEDVDGDGFAGVSNAGALQSLASPAPDRGAVRNGTGTSLDDPDRDEYCHELSEGDMDLVEWYLLNHPAPGRGRLTKGVRWGEAAFGRIGCTSCHVPDWHLHAAAPDAEDYTKRFDGDRRFFALDASYNDKAGRLEGHVTTLADARGGQIIPRRGASTLRGVYSDFKYHDLGEGYCQLQFDGTMLTRFRTTPLWGVAGSGPWGHDGASLSLDEAIRRHGGEALGSRKGYEDLSDAKRESLLAFLGSLVLYQTDALPCDINGDGAIDEHFVVAGMDTGPERFNPEWLFRVPGRIEGPLPGPGGRLMVSHALLNVPQSYGMELALLKDSDSDGFPDVMDAEPAICGYRNGRD